ncbi:PAS domain-containing sensor histidine kinase [Terrimonas pollutisoli]|uniref:PAS domain-containing sensor histidine kinase n=1 Tax=Terrimonas pollutisoli TaxID=3034147 RepID=UPI0023ED9D6F|nr:PAS domain-containing sensor histidine kinase [Terrimonas sp. H1YJ31]
MTSLFENATEGIILTGKDGKIVLLNPAAERMFNYASKELTGQPIEVLIPDRYKGHHHQLRDSFYDNPSNRVMGQNRDLYGRKKDGTDLPVEVSLSHYRKGNELFVIAFIVDITRRKEIEHSMLEQQKQLERVSNEIRKLNADLELKVEERTMILKEALQRLEQSQAELSEALDKERQLNEIKSRFVSMASHEFRTPLSTVLSSASLLSKYKTTEEQDKRNRHIDKIRNSVRHLNDILEDFLSLGKLDEGKVGISLSEFDLYEFIYETIEEMRGLLKKGQQIDFNCQGQRNIVSDKKLLKNILINLITNAIKFSDESGLISVQASVGNEWAVITITDTGIGISQEDQEHLFSSFFRGANAINIAGTGLGLHIVKRYADLLKGSVHLESELNKGTSITVTIPVNE